MSRTLLFTIIVSIAAHAAVMLYNGQEEESQQTLAMGSIKAPVSLTFSSVSLQEPAPTPKPEPVKEILVETAKAPKPKPIEKPKPKDAVKIPELMLLTEKPLTEEEPLVKKELEPEPQKKEVQSERTVEPKPSSEPQIVQSALEETEVEGLSEEPVFVTQPAIRSSVPPRYPRIAQRRNQQGVVMLEIVVDTSGKALNIKILESSGFDILDKSAIAAVQNWEFEPQTRNNELVNSRVQVPVAFRLN